MRLRLAWAQRDLTAARSGVPSRVRLCCEGRGTRHGPKGVHTNTRLTAARSGVLPGSGFAARGQTLGIWLRFGEPPLDNQLKCAFYQFRTWCTEEGHSPNIRRFGGLKPKPAEFPELNCKASDVPILLRWLIAILQPRGPCSDWQLMACAAAWNADALFTILAKADALLSPQ